MKRASCGLLYGAINTLKTTNLGRIARYLYETFGLTSRMITADNEYDTVEDLIEPGVLDVFAIKAVPNPFAIMTKLSQGYWPGSKNGRLAMLPTPPEVMAKIGAYLIEGTVTIGELLHKDHINKGRSIGQDVVGKFSDTVETDAGTETLSFAKSAQSHYQSVQDFVTFNLINDFSMLPVKWVWWTGHEYAGEDEATGRTRLGPGVVGKAAVTRVPRVVGNTFHMVSFDATTVDEKTHKTTKKVEHRAYFVTHADRELTLQTWPAGVKIPAQHVEEWHKRYPNGYIELLLEKQGVEKYLEFHQEIARQHTKLVITPGKEVYVTPLEQTASNSVVGQAALPASAPVTQTRPPVRGYRPVMRTPVLVPPQPPPPPTLEDQLKKSIEHVTGQPVVDAASRTASEIKASQQEASGSVAESVASIALSDINAVPTKEIEQSK